MMDMESIDMRFVQVEKRLDKTDAILDRLSEGQIRLIGMIDKQAEMQESIKRAFKSIEKVDNRVDELENAVQTTQVGQLKDIIAQQDKALDMLNRQKSQMLYDTLRMMIISFIVVLGTLAGAHFGLHIF
jgi:predicted nuclease with TOPRIM domain